MRVEMQMNECRELSDAELDHIAGGTVAQFGKVIAADIKDIVRHLETQSGDKIL